MPFIGGESLRQRLDREKQLAHAVQFVMVWDAGVCPAQINASACTLEK